MLKSVHTPEYASLLKALSEARVSAGFSQRELARLLGVPHTWVAKTEAGERRIDVVELAHFFVACNADFPAAITRLAARWKAPEFQRSSATRRAAAKGRRDA